MSTSDVKTLVTDYCDAFRPGNIHKLTNFFHFPVNFVMTGIRIQIACEEEFVSIVGGVISQLEIKGFKYSKVGDIYVSELAKGVAIVSARFERYKNNEELLEEVGATYSLFEDKENGWRIISVMSHPAENILVV